MRGLHAHGVSVVYIGYLCVTIDIVTLAGGWQPGSCLWWDKSGPGLLYPEWVSKRVIVDIVIVFQGNLYTTRESEPVA